MSMRPSLISVALALRAAACSESNGPGLQQPLTQGPHFLRWAGGSPPQFIAIGGLSGRGVATTGGGLLRASGPGGLSLGQYTVMFWAVRGQERSVQINYQSGVDDTHPFLRFTAVDPTYAPGLGELAVGDSVLVSVTVDPQDIKLSLEPTGLRFGEPALLQMWYGGADGDLNGDGVVDGSDAYIESQLLGLWYREGAVDPWIKISATQSLADKCFTSTLQHFSEYAVTW